jgi:uncharacterized protein (DUF2225 family)
MGTIKNRIETDINCPICGTKFMVINTHLVCEKCKEKEDIEIKNIFKKEFIPKILNENSRICSSCKGTGCWLCGNTGLM